VNTSKDSVKKSSRTDAKPVIPRARVVNLCPQCGGSVSRIPRRGLDRMLGMLVSIRRFRCMGFGCQWEGNLPSG
jgi:hypothetical protein